MITEAELVKKVRTLLNEAEQEGVSLITGDTLLSISILQPCCPKLCFLYR